jgi:type VI secretion system secreted protein Hcp
MPTPAYMEIEGETQGLITEGCNTPESVGNVFQENHENEFIVQAFESVVLIPSDIQTGQPSGMRQHKPVVVTKIFDICSPLLHQALTTGEILQCEIKWFRINIEGQQEHYFTHTLEDAMITKVEQYMPNCLDPNMGHFMHMERVSLTFRKIKWNHELASTEGSDDWRAPAQEE